MRHGDADFREEQFRALIKAGRDAEPTIQPGSQVFDLMTFLR